LQKANGAKSQWKEESILTQSVFKLVFSSDRTATQSENCSSTQPSAVIPRGGMSEIHAGAAN
jgi:hypothetical protein